MARPFADPRPVVLLLPLAVSVLLLGGAGAIALRRDIGSGLIESRDRRLPRLGLLSSPTAQALRLERGSLIGWLVGVGAFAAIVGVLSTTFQGVRLSQSIREELARFGADILTPSGILGFYFLFFVLAISLFACAQVVAARHEEAGQQLETLLALPVSRRRWLAGARCNRSRRGGCAGARGGRARVGRRPYAGRRRVAAGHARCRRELPADRAAVPRA
jgi:ABC-2 type transport system permease protein